MTSDSPTVISYNESSLVTWDSSADCQVVPYCFHVLVGLFVGAVAVCAAVGNFLVFCTFVRNPKLRTSSNLLIINLTVADFILASVNFPIFAVSSLRGCWMLGRIGCQIYGSTSSISSLVTINTLAAISFDRYIVVAHRPARMHRMAKSTIGYIIVIIWLLSITWSVVPFVGHTAYRLEGMGTSCTFNYVDQSTLHQWFFISLVTFNFFVPLLVITFSYWRIFATVKTVKQELISLQRGPTKGAWKRLMAAQTEIRISVTAILIIAIFSTAWTPYVIISFIGLFGRKDGITPLASMFPNILAKVCTVSNPVLYTIGHPQVRKKLVVLMASIQQTLWPPIVARAVNMSCRHFKIDKNKISDSNSTFTF